MSRLGYGSDLNPSKRIGTRIQTDNICTIYTQVIIRRTNDQQFDILHFTIGTLGAGHPTLDANIGRGPHRSTQFCDVEISIFSMLKIYISNVTNVVVVSLDFG